MKSAGLLILPVLMAACAAPPREMMQVTMTREDAARCYEDRPTGTRFTKVRCPSAEQVQEHERRGREAEEAIRSMRHAPLGDPRD